MARKVFLFAFVLITVTFAQDSKHSHATREEQEILGECAKNVTVSGDEYHVVLNVQDNIGPGCLMKCLYEKMGVINDKGEIQVNGQYRAIDENDPIRDAILKCQHFVVATCDDALLFKGCIDDVVKEITKPHHHG